MSENLERCLKLADEAGLAGVSVGEVRGAPAMLVNGKPTLIDHDGRLIRMKCSFEGCQVLLQTGGGAYSQDEEARARREVLADISRITDEELRIHIIQAWKLNATQEQLDAQGSA